MKFQGKPYIVDVVKLNIQFLCCSTAVAELLCSSTAVKGPYVPIASHHVVYRSEFENSSQRRSNMRLLQRITKERAKACGCSA